MGRNRTFTLSSGRSMLTSGFILQPMITKYFADIKVLMPTVGKSAKTCRVFLANLPPRQRQNIKLDCKVLDPGAGTPRIEVKYKDGTTLECDPEKVQTVEMFELFDRQSRKLQVNDSLKE